VVRKPKASTGRGVAVGSTFSELVKRYDTEHETSTIHFTDEKKVKQQADVRRHNQLGIAFLIQGNEVTSITLYPAREAP
jgi:hypothetical protein